MRTCSYCGKELEDNINFCPSCGQEVEKLKCPKCHEEVNEEETYCHHCGERLSKEKLSQEEKKKIKSELKKSLPLAIANLVAKIFALLIPLALIGLLVLFPIIKEGTYTKILDVFNIDQIKSIGDYFTDGGDKMAGFNYIFQLASLGIYIILLVVFAIINIVKCIISLTSFYKKGPNYKFAITSYGFYVGIVLIFNLYFSTSSLLEGMELYTLIGIGAPLAIYLFFYVLKMIFDKEDRKVKTIIASILKILAYIISFAGIYFLYNGFLTKDGNVVLINEIFQYQTGIVTSKGTEANIMDQLFPPLIMFSLILFMARIPLTSGHKLVNPRIKNDKMVKNIVKELLFFIIVIGLEIGSVYIFNLGESYTFSITLLSTILPIGCSVVSLILTIVAHILANKPKIKILYV